MGNPSPSPLTFVHLLLEVLIVIVAAAGCTSSVAQQAPTLGRPATPAEIAGWDISIPPDGAGLPPGSGTPEQGVLVYAQKCQSCHGEKGAGQPNDQLVGGQGTLTSNSPVRTIGSYWPYATTVFDYIRRAMPYQQPQSLTNGEVYSPRQSLLYTGAHGRRPYPVATTSKSSHCGGGEAWGMRRLGDFAR